MTRADEGSGPRRPPAARAQLVLTLTLPTEERAAYAADNRARVREYLAEQLPETVSFTVRALPSRDWALQLERDGIPPADPTPPERNWQVVVLIDFERRSEARRFVRLLPRGFAANVALGADLPAFAADAHRAGSWCPAEADDPVFGTRRDTATLIGAAALAAAGCDGSDVNVVVMDRGIDRRRVPAENWFGGWRFRVPAGAEAEFPGETERRPGRAPFGHGNMIVRNVLALAPRARILDCPLLPPTIRRVPGFLGIAQAAWLQVLADIEQLRAAGTLGGRWVLCNPWNVYDLRAERTAAPEARYSDNPQHPFNLVVGQAAAADVDVVFSAGNCGQFCADGRCGGPDIGPGRSVFGAASHPDALSVGAVRADGLWLGYASQGPGMLAERKPDLVAPAQFAENDDAGLLSGGTSAACGLAAGAIAALRTRGAPAATTSPASLRDALTDAARRPPASGWSPRTGWGVLDLSAMLAATPGTVA